jgi:hypothetical protein
MVENPGQGRPQLAKAWPDCFQDDNLMLYPSKGKNVIPHVVEGKGQKRREDCELNVSAIKFRC